jgi:pyridoxal phosphate enzyme (YggS family)
MTHDLGDRLAAIRERVAEAARRSGREPEAITTIVVTKFQPVELVRELRELGVTDFGENRHQEARRKAALVPDVRWHFIGQLQGKKARQVRDYASVIHSIDRASLVDALDVPLEHGETSVASKTVDVFAQVNLTDDPARGGADPAEIPALAERIEAAAGLRLLGVMAVAPLGEDPRTAFARLRTIGEEVRRIAPTATAMSAGMSGDFEDAIAEGATHLRIGTAITGSRPDPA